MTELSTLYRRAEELNIPVLHFPLPLTGSVSYMDGAGNCAIGLDLPHRRSRNELRVRLAHELGHCVTGSFYNRCSPWDVRRLHENRADKYAVHTLIPEEALDAAVAEGHTEPWDLADYFGVDEAFLKKAVCLYTYGNLAAELYF
ncbi:MAG: ImmA/IrrE family metallo-endopeptidase [Acidaminococcaceae bacterium]|nr:ImmA/IrrE family metallo-endopeptidase [Acidaminococcaceae bacterium]